MTEYENFYCKLTPASARLYQKTSQLMPGGVSHNLRYNHPYPPFYKRGKGAYFEDVDGNRYLDFWMGHYANILGHSPDIITARLQELLSEGVTHCGLVNEYEVRLAELVCEIVPVAEQIRFCVTGTEASMYALRLARAYTGRDLVIKVEGGWHGANSDLMLAVSSPYNKAESLGLSPEIKQRVITIPFNNSQTATEVISENASRLAALIIEPVIGVSGFIPADKEFLTTLRRETEKCGALLIFDEIISGFRVALGGAQELLDMTPDLSLLGKILGAGMPVAAIAGKKRVMETADFHKHPNAWERVAIGGGTFSCSPLAMAAGFSMLTYLKENQAAIYPQLAKAGNWVRENIEKAFIDNGIEAVCSGIGSLFMTHFPLKAGLEIKNAHDTNCLTDVRKREKELKARLLAKGVYVMHGGGAVSTAHSNKDLEIFVDIMREAASEMRG